MSEKIQQPGVDPRTGEVLDRNPSLVKGFIIKMEALTTPGLGCSHFALKEFFHMKDAFHLNLWHQLDIDELMAAWNARFTHLTMLRVTGQISDWALRMDFP